MTCWGQTVYIVCCTVVYISSRNSAVAEIADRTAVEILEQGAWGLRVNVGVESCKIVL